MTITKAIEVLSELREITFINASPDRNKAMKLGHEALNLVKEKRGYPEYIIPMLLPGETLE